MPETRTGPKIRETATAMREDLGEVAGSLQGVAAFLEALEDDTRAANGLPGQCRKWRLALEQMASEVQGEAREVDEKLFGGPAAKIAENVNLDLAARAKAARATP